MGPDYAARFLLLALILVVNGFFAASEVALLSVRDSRLRHLAEEGSAGAKTALALLARPERLLSVTQIGVTLASLGLGWAGEDTLYALFTDLFHPLVTPPWAAVARAACFVLAFALMTYCHVVIGEVVPKNLAIDKADRVAIVVAPALMLFYRLTSFFVIAIERSATGITRLLGGRASHRGGVHSAEELKLIVSSSRFSGHLPREQEDMIHRVLDLEEYSVREIMKPRREIVSIPMEASLDQVLETMVESQHSRLPVWKEKPEQMVGVVLFKDMLILWHERRRSIRTGRGAPPFHLEQIVRKPLIVPETKPLTQILREFRQGHTHIALVVDEFGTVTGLVTVEDVLEQIVGEIEDEFDEKAAPPRALTHDEDLDGATTIRDFGLNYGIELPADAGFETIAGYMLARLGHIPRVGESVEFEDRRFTVTAMERNRIARVRMEKIAATPVTATEASSAEPEASKTETLRQTRLEQNAGR
jgi:CBS domain containing-hemolysin-like protein